MDTFRSIVERIAFALFRLEATCLLAAGVALIAAAGTLMTSGGANDFVPNVVARLVRSGCCLHGGGRRRAVPRARALAAG